MNFWLIHENSAASPEIAALSATMILTITHKELKILLGSPAAWIVLALVQMVLTWTFLAHLEAFLEIQPQLLKIANPPGVTEAIIAPVFAMASAVLLMITPLFAARLIAEERRNHTLVFLLSAPVSVVEIVLGKFLSLLILLSLVIVLATFLSISLLAGGTLDFGLLLSNIAGLLLVSACLASFGLYISTLSSHPTLAAATALGILLGLWVVDMAAEDEQAASIGYISPLSRYQSFNKGFIDTFDLAYFLLFTLVFLVLAMRRMDGERIGG
jgi:ABC-2 type transport system permease protein